MSKADRLTGRVKFWSEDRGFGFIQQAAEERELFMNVADWVELDMPRAGDRVTFVERQDRSGRPCAKSVMRAAV
jgi:cold shock CspA family protein